MGLVRVWRRHFLPVEFGAALLVWGFFVLWAEEFDGVVALDYTLQGNRGAVYGTAASIFGALLGFVIAAVAIVLGYADSPRLAVLRASKHYTTLWRVFIANIRALAFATVVALLALVLDRDGAPVHLLLYATAFAALLVGVRLGRAMWILENVIHLVTKDHSGSASAERCA